MQTSSPLYRAIRTRPTLFSRPFSTTSPRPLARTHLIGRLAAEPESTTIANGREIIRYAVGTSHGNKDNQTTSWFQVACFEDHPSRREYLMSLPKGTLVYVEAESRMRSYDSPDGSRRTQLSLVQQKLDVLSRPQSSREQASQEDAAGLQDDAALAASG